MACCVKTCFYMYTNTVICFVDCDFFNSETFLVEDYAIFFASYGANLCKCFLNVFHIAANLLPRKSMSNVGRAFSRS